MGQVVLRLLGNITNRWIKTHFWSQDVPSAVYRCYLGVVLLYSSRHKTKFFRLSITQSKLFFMRKNLLRISYLFSDSQCLIKWILWMNHSEPSHESVIRQTSSWTEREFAFIGAEYSINWMTDSRSPASDVPFGWSLRDTARQARVWQLRGKGVAPQQWCS